VLVIETSSTEEKKKCPEIPVLDNYRTDPGGGTDSNKL
jgi:hypothetical protein